MSISDRDLPFHGSLHEQVAHLWREQVESWLVLADGLAAMRHARTRRFDLNGSVVTAQCNPARVQSSSANSGANHAGPRRCVLCPENRPTAQQAIVYRDRWVILCNPVPILEPHFTIASIEHTPQRLASAIPTLLQLARDLNGLFTVFYNGPDCGASLPDHLHLQATAAECLPFEKELAEQLQHNPCNDSIPSKRQQTSDQPAGIDWVQSAPLRIGITYPPLRTAVVLMGHDADALSLELARLGQVLNDICPAIPEPRLNLFARYTPDGYCVWAFPRAVHYPSTYGTGPDDFLIRPGAIDLGGILIAPRPHDFDRLDEAVVRSIYDEVLLLPEDVAILRDQLAD